MKRIKLTEFWSPFCGPCKQMSGILKKLQDEYQNSEEVEILTLDAYEEVELAEKYMIRSVPTIVVEEFDIEVARHVGFKDESQIRGIINEALNGKV